MDFYLNDTSRILDFGCGDGHIVYEYHDAGFKAYGFDIRPAAILRRPEDEQYFRFAFTGKPVNVPEYAVTETSYKIPFDDGSFDFLFSTSTFEHVANYELAFAESARVLRQGGVAIHTFPARYVLIEPHIYVPFGGAIQHYYWFLLWASLGIRNEFQKTMTARECAKNNVYYTETGLKYLKTSEILKICRANFGYAELLPGLWELGDRGFMSFKGGLLGVPFVKRYYRWLYNRCYQNVLVLQK